MNAFQLQKPDTTPLNLWACGECGSLYGKDLPNGNARAERCCTTVHCRECNAPMDAKWTRLTATAKCRSCEMIAKAKREAERFAKAEKLADWDGWVYSDGIGSNDGYFESVEALVDHLWDQVGDEEEGAWPEYAWACKPKPFKLDIGRVIENECDDLAEDFDFDIDTDLFGLEALRLAVDAFNQANAHVVTYREDYRRAVLIPSLEDVKAEEEAKRAARGPAN